MSDALPFSERKTQVQSYGSINDSDTSALTSVVVSSASASEESSAPSSTRKRYTPKALEPQGPNGLSVDTSAAAEGTSAIPPSTLHVSRSMPSLAARDLAAENSSARKKRKADASKRKFQRGRCRCKHMGQYFVYFFTSIDDLLYFFLLLAVVLAAFLRFFFADVCFVGDENPLYYWPALVAGVMLTFQLARFVEHAILWCFSFTIGTRLWKIYFYASAINDSLRKLFTVTAIMLFRYEVAFFTWPNEVAKIVDPVLLFLLALYTMWILRKLVMKNIMLRLNRDQYTPKIEQMFFIDKVIKRLVRSGANYVRPPDDEGDGPDSPTSSANAKGISLSFSLDALRGKGSEAKSASAVGAAEGKAPSQRTVSAGSADKDKAALEEEGWAKMRMWEEYVTSSDFLETEANAVRTAHQIMEALDRENKGYICLADFARVLPPGSVVKAFNLFRPAGNSDSSVKKAKAKRSKEEIEAVELSAADVREAVMQLREKRMNLEASLDSWNNLSDMVSYLSALVFYALLGLVVLLVFKDIDDDFKHLLLPLSSLLFTAGFMMTSTVRDYVKGISFIFVTKPYEVGDRVDVGKAKYKVRSIALLSTTFSTLDNKVCIVPNSKLATQMVVNVTRSANAAITIPIEVSFYTSAEQIGKLREAVVAFVRERPAEYNPNVAFNITGIKQANSVMLSFRFSHKASWAQPKQWKKAKSELLTTLRDAMIRLDIRWNTPAQVVAVKMEGADKGREKASLSSSATAASDLHVD